MCSENINRRPSSDQLYNRLCAMKSAFISCLGQENENMQKIAELESSLKQTKELLEFYEAENTHLKNLSILLGLEIP